MILNVEFPLKLGNCASWKRLIYLKWILNFFPQYYILILTNIHCRLLPLRNWVFATNPDYYSHLFLNPDSVDLLYFKLWILLILLLDQIVYVWNLTGLHCPTKIKGSENLNLWQKLNSFEHTALYISLDLEKLLEKNHFVWFVCFVFVYYVYWGKYLVQSFFAIHEFKSRKKFYWNYLYLQQYFDNKLLLTYPGVLTIDIYPESGVAGVRGWPPSEHLARTFPPSTPENDYEFITLTN